MPPTEILCVGELLWDALPAGLFLGGAPFNVACHLRAAGLPVALVSRVGEDRLGDEAVRRAARFGVDTSLVQRDAERPTGFARVALDAAGSAGYEIEAPAAWDAIEATDAVLARAAAARVVVFGSLAQRAPVTRRTIARLWESGALHVFDANLRPPHDDREVVRASLRRAGVVKLADRELRQLAAWFALPAGDAVPTVRTVAALAEQFDCGTVCVTRGRTGAALWRDGRWTEHAGFDVEVRDNVGAGDAFLAVLLAGLLSGAEDRLALQHASLIGAYVATQSGAVPADQPAALAPPLAPAPPAPPAAPAAAAPARSRARRAPRRGPADG